MDLEQLRRLSLIEVLKEDFSHVPEPAEAEWQTWSEQDIRAYFVTGGAAIPAPSNSGAHNTHCSRQQRPPISAAAAPPPATSNSAEFGCWFPGHKLPGTAFSDPRFTLLCFHSAGCAEDMFTSEGTGARRAPSPLLAWARDKRAQVLAVQLPGRGLRLREPPAATLQEVAQRLLPLVGRELCRAPYAVVAHSMGAWAAHELLLALQKQGVPPPMAAFLSAMPAPDIPMEQRPWRQQRTLSEEAFKEECRGWDVSEAVFSPGMWDMYQSILRADFRLFDEYQPSVAGSGDEPPFAFPVVAFWGACDRRVTRYMVQGWERFTSGRFEEREVQGHHLWPLQPQAKQQWLQAVVQHLDNCCYGA